MIMLSAKDISKYEICIYIPFSVIRDRSEPLKDFSLLQKGDIVCFERNGLVRYKHHGIVLSVINRHKIDVIHLTGDVSDLFSSSFGGGQAGIHMNIVVYNKETVCKYTYPEQRADGYNPADVACIIRTNGLPESYNLLNFNCESFTTYCAIGKVVSKQTRRDNEETETKLNELVKQKLLI